MKEYIVSNNDNLCYECGQELGEFDTPPYGPPRHFICPSTEGT